MPTATEQVLPGTTGTTVAQLQDSLRKDGFDPGPQDGVFGPKTEAAVAAQVGAEPRLARGSHGKWVKVLQRKLAAVGADPGPIDGIFGPKTEHAVRHFQHHNLLTMTGVVAAGTWHKLDTAPKPHFRASIDRSRIYYAQPNGWSCAPSALTMAEAAWGVAHANSNTMFRLARGMHDGPGVGLPGNASLVAAQARRDRLHASYNPNRNASAVRAALRQGRTCVVNGALRAVNDGHFIYIGGLDSQGRFIVFDPARRNITRWTDRDLNSFTHLGQNPPGFAEIWR